MKYADVSNYLKRLYLKNTNYYLNTKNYEPGAYGIFIIDKKTGNRAGYVLVEFDNSNKSMLISRGGTKEKHQRKGLGELLRALATKIGKIANANVAFHEGNFTNNTSRKLGVPASTRILTRLGWKIKGPNGKFLLSSFNYKTHPMNKVNSVINKKIYVGARSAFNMNKLRAKTRVVSRVASPR